MEVQVQVAEVYLYSVMYRIVNMVNNTVLHICKLVRE